MKNAEERFSEKYQAIPESGCWIWTGGIWSGGRYGAFWENGKQHKAHKKSY